MVTAIAKAREAARKAIEATYDGVCAVVERQSVTGDGFITRQKEVRTIENEACKLSFETLSAVDQTGTGARQAQIAKLFIAPEVVIKSGSKIIVTQNGVTTEYAESGVSAVYGTHKEIMLKLFKEWA